MAVRVTCQAGQTLESIASAARAAASLFGQCFADLDTAMTRQLRMPGKQSAPEPLLLAQYCTSATVWQM
jgi:hypothetical protein